MLKEAQVEETIGQPAAMLQPAQRLRVYPDRRGATACSGCDGHESILRL
jgi:hypothetical protein